MVALLTARIGGELDRFDRMRMEKIEASLDGFLGDQLRMQKKACTRPLRGCTLTFRAPRLLPSGRPF